MAFVTHLSLGRSAEHDERPRGAQGVWEKNCQHPVLDGQKRLTGNLLKHVKRKKISLK